MLAWLVARPRCPGGGFGRWSCGGLLFCRSFGLLGRVRSSWRVASDGSAVGAASPNLALQRTRPAVDFLGSAEAAGMRAGPLNFKR